MKFRPLPERQYAVLVLSAFMLAACATPYQPPTTGSTAKIMFDSSLPAARGAYLHDNSECANAQLVSPFDEGKWLTLKAGEPVWIKRDFNTVGLPYGRYCDALTTFLPQENESYVVTFEMDAAGCSSGVFRIDAAGARVREPSAHPFKHPKCKSF